MDPFDELLIKKYLAIDKEISRLIKYKAELKEVFYSQNMATRLVYDIHGIHSEGFRQDRKVLDYLESLDMVDERIKRVEIRQKYFDQYLITLSGDEIKSLDLNISNLPEKLKSSVLDEIDQIEAAICLREGVEVNEIVERITLTDNFEENISLLSDLFAI